MTNIAFGGWGGVAEDEGVKEAIAVFMEENPDIAVQWQHTPSASEYSRVTLTNIAAGTAPDTSFIRSDDYETLAIGGALMDITDLVKTDPLLGQPGYFIEPQESTRCEVNGRWYGIGSTWVAHHFIPMAASSLPMRACVRLTRLKQWKRYSALLILFTCIMSLRVAHRFKVSA